MLIPRVILPYSRANPCLKSGSARVVKTNPPASLSQARNRESIAPEAFPLFPTAIKRNDGFLHFLIGGSALHFTIRSRSGPNPQSGVRTPLMERQSPDITASRKRKLLRRYLM